MLREEWRLHRSLIGWAGSGLFPLFILVLSAGLALAARLFLTNLSTSTILLMLHVASVMYGLFVGALGHVGERVMTRRLGQINMLLQIPQIQPISFKRTLTLFFLKDAVFYVVYSFIPITLGVALVSSVIGVSLRGVGLLGVTMLLTFFMGMGLSFLVSASAARSRRLAGALTLTVLAMVSAVWPLGMLKLGHLLFPLGYWSSGNPLLLVASLLVASAFSVAGTLAVKERFDSVQHSQRSILLPTEGRFAFTKDMSTLMAKEWLELRRSGTMAQVTMGYVGVLLGVYFIIWLFEEGVGIPLPFNVVSYAGFVGFMGVITYSWLTVVEPNECLNAMPMTVDRVVWAKILIYLLITAGISAGYVTLIAALRGELGLLIPAIVVSEVTSIYTVAVTAYLTALWTNTMFFDVRVLIKFSAAVVPLLTMIEVASLWILGASPQATAAIGAAIALELALSVQFIRGINGRWGKASFTFTATET
ncbi:MAG TPA: hypothetical protein VM050_11610 [Patescibacteria group bacterium]|nr:hypothetical protein [Patescibacteria group bacterium]